MQAEVVRTANELPVLSPAQGLSRAFTEGMRQNKKLRQLFTELAKQCRGYVLYVTAEFSIIDNLMTVELKIAHIFSNTIQEEIVTVIAVRNGLHFKIDKIKKQVTKKSSAVDTTVIQSADDIILSVLRSALSDVSIIYNVDDTAKTRIVDSNLKMQWSVKK